MQADDPPFLPVGTDVSAKYKGAFCEAKIKKVVRNIKCKVTFKAAGAGSTTVSDDVITGTLRVGNTVEVKVDQKKELLEANIIKIQDCSQYTVVFDDGDITTLRRSALCLKSGRHFAESETLDQLPLTHPEHFGNPVIGASGRRGRRTNRTQSDDSDSEASEWAGGSSGQGAGLSTAVTEREPHAGRVVLVQCSTGDKKRAHHSHQWFPGLVVAPNAQDTVKIKVKDDYLVRSFKDGRYYTVPKKEAREFRRNSVSTEWSGMDAAILYLDKNILPPHWDREILFGQESQSQSDEIDSDDSMDDEPHEEKDHFVAQLYKFMDDRGTPLNKQPAIAAKDINLYRLFNVVQKLGGYNKVTNQNQWKKIAQRLGFVPATPSVSNLCRQAYKKYLHSFEEFYRKLGVTLLSFPRSGRTAGRSLIRDRDKMHSSYSQKSASPAPANTNTVSEEKTSESTSNKVSGVKGKDKDTDKEGKKEKESKTKDVDVKITAKEKDTKEKETKELKEKEPKSAEKEKDVKVKEKIRETKEKEVKEKDVKEKTKDKENNSKSKQKETKIKTEPIASSEEDSGDNQPLAPLSIKPEKIEPSIAVEKPAEKTKSVETPVKTSKIFKSSSGTIDGKKTEKGSSKKITHRRNSLPRCTSTGSKSDTFTKAEARCKSSSSDSSTTTKKQLVDSEKNKDKDSSFSTTSAKKHVSSSDKNDSDSSSRGSKNGKIPSRRNLTPNESTPPSTPSSSSSQHKKPRKRKITEPSDTTTPVIHADVGDKLKVYYGPTHSESKVTYEAKVIEIDGKGTETLLRVHYTGWNTRYDEWIKPSRIADNLTQHSKNKHKDKGKRSSAGSGPPESTTSKKSRTSQPSSVTSSPVTSKPHTRNRVSNNNTSAPNQAITESSIQSESESDIESDSSEQRQQKKISDDNKSSTSEKVLSESPTITSEKPLEKTPDSANKEKSKISKIPKTPQIKRNAEGSQNRVKRTRLKQEDNISPRGRDYDLNEIRSELKGLDTTLKTPVKDIKIETTIQTTVDEIKISYKQEKTPEKVTEDIYEFKEPEPFEFEARKSEEKKKRLPPHRIFDDIPPLKLSPNASPEKPVIQEPEKPVSKTHYEIVFDKLYRIDSIPPVEESSIPVEKEGEALSLFCELGGEDSADKFVISEAEDSEEPLFTYQPELFPEKPYIPIFKGFTPAKNQETYSKKDAASKIRDIEDDFTNSPIKGEQSSDEDPIDAAIQRVNTQTMSDDSNDVDLLIKTPSTPTAPSVGLLPTFTSDTSIDTSSKEVLNVEITDIQQKSKLEVLLKLQTEPAVMKSTPQDVIVVHKKDFVADVPSEPKAIALMEVSETSLEIKSESDNTPSFADVVMPEPPAGFLLHKEGPSIAEKVLRALSSAKRASTPPITKEPAKLSKPDPVKSIKSILPKNPTLKVCVTNIQPTIICPETVPSQVSMDTEQATAQPVQKLDQIKTDIKIDVQRKDTNTILPDPPPKPDLVTTKSETPLSSIKKDAIERRKSVAEPALGGKSNKVLSETIQKLSSQISQPTPALSIPEYPNDDRSDTTDSDDSDSRLIIDKLSEEESQSCISLSENSTSQPLKAQVDKSNMPWSSNVDSNQDTDHEKSCNIPDLSTKDSIPKQPEEDSNISLLLCEETIPGSPAPENLGEAAKNASKSRTRNLEIPFASAPSISPDQASKEPSTHKDVPRERDIPRELREAGLSARNERECHGGNNPTADTVMDNTPPTTPESSIGNISPNRDQQLSDVENQCDMKIIDEDPVLVPSKKMNEIDKSSSASNVRNSAPNSPGTGPRRGRRPRGCRLSDSEDQSALTSLSHSNSHRQLKYNFCVEFDPLLDGAARIALITSRLSELRKVYHSLKAELATIDRRRKKLRRKEREAIKAAKAACS